MLVCEADRLREMALETALRACEAALRVCEEGGAERLGDVPGWPQKLWAALANSGPAP
jgi:hypothetical protein